LVLKASFGEIHKSGEPPKTRLRLQELSEHLETIGATVAERPKRILLALPGFRVQFFINEDPMLYNTAVDEIDLDSDGKIGEYELANFLERQRPVFRALVRTWVAGHEDPLFAALDADGDGMLGARELHQSQDLLKSLDRNNDGRVQSHETPDAMVVRFARGSPLRDSELFVISSSPSETERPSPAWFTAMDTNRDGEISHREFLGTADQFQQLDRDADGFVDPREARSAKGV
jgi:Ca2+-binding EF-hand superfamily protein